MDPLERAITTLLLQELPQDDSPPRSIALGLELEEDWKPTVLAIGRALRVEDGRFLAEKGCELVVVDHLSSGLGAMGLRHFDVVVIDPHVGRERGGIQFVRALKRMPASVDAIVPGISARFARVPFIIAPAEGKSDFAVTRDGRWFAGKTEQLQIGRAVLLANRLIPDDPPNAH